jgi:SAM-dependent methyltransferase
MIQLETFASAKQIARLELGSNWRTSYLYWSDTKRQWEQSHDSSKPLEIIGGQSAPRYMLEDTRAFVGDLSAEEAQLAKDMAALYGEIGNLQTSLPVVADPEIDILETIIDMRILKQHVSFPCRILDIGPGSGRNMVGLFQSDAGKGSVYAGVESIGIPYHLQNLTAKLLRGRNPDLTFYEFLDYQFARLDQPLDNGLSENAIWHLPLWEAGHLPDRSFDLVICNYVLDELPPDDFGRVMQLIDRCLTPDGIVYCRGSQHRAQIANLYLYGYGTYHGTDISKAMDNARLEPKYAELIGGAFTRIFARPETSFSGGGGKYCEFREDIPLMRMLQEDFTKQALQDLAAANAKVLVWSDVGYADYDRFIAPYWDGLDIIGMTHRLVADEGVTPFGFMEYPLEKIRDLDVDCVIFASNRIYSYHRQLREIVGDGKFERVRSFSLPIAFAFHD